LRDQFGEEAAGGQGVDADAKTTAFSRTCHGRSLHRMVELINAGRHLLDEAAASLGQPDTACMALEQEYAKIFLQRLYPRADAGNADTERARGVAEFRYSATASVWISDTMGMRHLSDLGANT